MVAVSATAAGSTLIPLTFAVVVGAMTSSLLVQASSRWWPSCRWPRAPGDQHAPEQRAHGQPGGSQLNLPPQLRAAAREVVRKAFGSGVTRIYASGAALIVIALMVLLALPEIPLRMGTHPGPAAGPPGPVS